MTRLPRTDDVNSTVILRQAATDLEAFGWCQRNYFTLSGARCALGAITGAFQNRLDIDASRLSIRALDLLGADAAVIACSHRGGGVGRRIENALVEFNDAPTTTRDDVTALFRRVADLLDPVLPSTRST